jgi:hypothetical protein
MFFCINVNADNSFVAKGKISKLLVTPDGGVIVMILGDGGCNKESYYLSSSAKSNKTIIDIILIALDKQMTIGLHNSTGANCNDKKVYFDLITIQNY